MSPRKISSPVAHVFLDFDYTLVPEESTIQILQYALEHHPGASHIKELIKSMGPKTSADQIRGSEIWTLIKAATYLRWKHVQRYVEKIKRQVHPFVSADYYTPKPLDSSILSSKTIKRVDRPEDLFQQIMTALQSMPL